nr:nebulin [Ciona intestinalis]|eukprot:XP_026693118.1 nebulin [Ciona intestinalis]
MSQQQQEQDNLQQEQDAQQAQFVQQETIVDDETQQQEGMSQDKWKGKGNFMTPQMMHALKMSQTQSQHKYKQKYNNEVKGRGFSAAGNSLDAARVRKNTAVQSSIKYHESFEKSKGTYTPVNETPELHRIRCQKHLSDTAYRSGLSDVLDRFKGFQRLEYKDYADVQRSLKAAEISDKNYKEDWEYDKSNVCYPATLTSTYDANTKAQRNASNKYYKEGLSKSLENVHYDVTKTELYKKIQDHLKATSSNEYKSAYEKNKANYTPIPYTPDMIRFRALSNVMNWNMYTAEARKLWEHYHLVVPIPIIAQALQTAKMTSQKWYKADFKRDCIGKSGPADIIHYPQLQQARKAAGFASKVEYTKAADKAKSHYTLAPDAPDFIRAKKAAESSNIKYKQQKAKTIADFQGYQRLDPSMHPVLVKTNKTPSDKEYKEDWEYDKQVIYYPVHMTPGYEQTAEVKQVQKDSYYKKEFEKNKAKNKFDVTTTSRYADMKADMTSDVKYKNEYEKNRGRNHTEIPETHEMSLSHKLQPVLSKKQYTQKSKEQQKNVHVGSDVQDISHAVEKQKQASKNSYKTDYKQNVVGKPPSDVTAAYPEHDLHKKMTHLTSKPEYTKEAEKLRQSNNLPPDHPDFARARQSAMNASDIEYTKQKKEAIDTYRGFQTMDSRDHPVVQQASKASQLMSDKNYREDWEYDKQVVYYPVHITPAYEQAADVKKVQSDATYKEGYNKGKDKNKYDVTTTEKYMAAKELENTSSDVKYKSAYEMNKGKNQTSIPETHEMSLSKELQPVLSKKQYTQKSKEQQQHVHVGSDVQEISHAVSTQQQASKQVYKKDYKKNIVGRGPQDPVQAYPEHDQHRKATNLTSSADYHKDAEEMMHHHTLPVDAPEFIRAKEAAKIASNLEYQKQKKEVIDKYRGFQTMDSSDHPIVQQGIKVAEMVSNIPYKEDWDYDKQNVYYPVHITPGYEQAADVKKVQSDATYKEGYNKGKDKNKYDVTATEKYMAAKELENTSSDVKYKSAYEMNKGKNQTSIPETHEMTLSKELQPVLSKKQYTQKSKDQQKNVHVGSDVQEISHAVSTQQQASKQVYKEDFNKNIVGKGPQDPAKSYPEYDLLREVSKQASKSEYVREADKMMHTHNLPLDYPEFVRAKENAINASDRQYQKQKKEVIDKYRGFQTMDSSDHPIVQQGIKVAEMVSNIPYKEDWDYDKQNVYYPVHITPGYEQAADVKKVQSDATYKEGYNKEKDKNKYDVTATEQYKFAKELENTSSNVNYKNEYEKNKGKNQTSIPETHEMSLSKELQPVLSKKQYTQKSKDQQKNVHVGSDVQEISRAVSTQQQASKQVYKEDFNKNIVGKGPQDPAKSYPEYDLLREVSKQASKAEYVREADKMMHTHNLPLDYPEFVRAKENAINASDRQYQKQKKEVIDKYRGFQTMDSSDHPIVQQGIKVAEMVSNIPYKEDWDYDKQNVYYPVHITPGYEQAADVKKVQSDTNYKEGYNKEKDKNKFNVTDTEQYKFNKELDNTSSNTNYKSEYEKNKGKNQTSIPETYEMTLSKELQPVLSKKQYTQKSKEQQQHVHVGSDVQEISHAVSTQQQASKQVYKEDFKKNIVGKGPQDPAKSYPEYDLLRQVSKQASKAEYVREADKMMHTHNLPLDYPEFVRAKENAINASDRQYQKQKKEVIDKYRGFQTMDSSDHPIVQQGIKVAEMVSNIPYKEDWDYDKQNVYYPVHITPGYEQAADVKKVQSDATYKKGFNEDKDKNKYNVTDTEQYKFSKELENTASDVKYKSAYEMNKGKNQTSIPETHEMSLSKELQPVLSKKQYTQKSKEQQKNVHVGSDVQEISHAVSTQQQASKQVYKEDFNKNIVGKGPQDPAKSYPEYDLLRQVSKQASKAEYVREADKMMHTHNLPLDYPEFVRAKENAINASDRQYQKQKKEVIDKYRGFQTMDSSDHPIVQQGIKVAEMVSNIPYKEDWDYDKQNVYYPVHITPGYEQAADVKKVQSDAIYKKGFNEEKDKNKFNVTDTEQYKFAKELGNTSSDVNYRSAYEMNKGKNQTSIPETHEMSLSKELQPVLSKKQYTQKSKDQQKNVHVGSDVQGISHAVSTQKLASDVPYHANYDKEMLGRAPADVANAYPEYKQLREVSKQSSKAEYVREADKMMHTHNLPLDYPEFVRAKENAKNASDLEYKKQKKEVIDKYRGFQTMDSNDHPIVQHGIRVADLISDRNYREDWEYEKHMIYYPVHITPGYEQALDVTKYQSKAAYLKNYDENKSKNKFKVTDTEQYQTAKNLLELVSDKNYPDGLGPFHSVSETHEMERAKSLQPLKETVYSKEARKVLNNYNLDSSTQGISHALLSQKNMSRQEYLENFKKNVLGKCPKDLESYPEYKFARDVSNMASKRGYVREADKMMHTHNLPLDYPEFVRAKENAINASDRQYQKQKKEVIDKYRGFQTMDSSDHPIVQQGIKAAELVSDKTYKEDWEYDKQMIYFPAHITPGYEATVAASDAQSDTKYKKNHKETKALNKFKVTDTEQYKSNKATADLVSEVKYREDYEAKKGKNVKQIEETPEMVLSKSLRPIVSNKLYMDSARKIMQKYNLDASMQGIAQALSSQKVANRHQYVEDFKKNVVGKAPADLTGSYPEYDHAREVSKMISKPLYVKEADKIMHHHNLPLDYPEFVRAKENAINASDRQYQKQKKEVIDKYRGFQTMDSNDHPIVQHGIKAAELISDRKYKEDYMADKDIIYYPVHLTPGYEAAVKSNEHQSDVSYKKAHNKEGGKNNYKFAETDTYKGAKEMEKLKDHIYKGEYPRDFTAIELTPEMEISNLVKTILSHSKYTKDAKKRLDVYNVDIGDQRLSHAMHATQIGSENLYRKRFLKETHGKAPADVTIAHPEYEHAKEVGKMISKPAYIKEADKMMHHHNLPLDYPEFVRAKENAINASDRQYQKQKKEVIDKYRGFQTMDSSDHPIVQHGIKAAELVSQARYIEDYLADRSIIYFPAHLTPTYEAASKAAQYSDPKYKEKYEKLKGTNKFDPTSTEQYGNLKQSRAIISEKSYKEDGMKRLATEFSPLDETHEMVISKQLKPLQPAEYQKLAKELQHKYHLNVELPEITHAICVSQLASKNKYIDDYAKNVKGKAPADIANSYPEYIHARNVSKQTSKAEYTKSGEEARHKFTLPVDTPELNRVKQASINASDLEYKKQKKAVIDKYRGFQTMDSNDHPIVQQGIKAAELVSEKRYKEDYMADRDMIYYPVHLTPGYEATQATDKIKPATYTAKHNKEKQQHRFNMADTEHYAQTKDQQLALLDQNYKVSPEEMSKLTPVSDSLQQSHLKDMKDMMSHKSYTESAKKLLEKYNLSADVIQIAHVLATSPLVSDVNYRENYLSELKGKGVSKPGIEHYPGYIQAKENTKLASKSEYVKAGESILHQYTMPLDTPELNRAKQSAINASDLEYTKQRKQTIDNYRGFQTMDSKHHPIVQHGIKAADLISERKYKEDYMEDRNLIYYPVHLTAGYECATKASQFMNKQSYQKNYLRDRNDVHYDVTKTDGYKNMVEMQKLSDASYKADPASGKFTSVKDSIDLARARAVKPLVSYWFYKDEAKRMLDKYNVDSADYHMVHALHANHLASDVEYRNQWLKEVKGKGNNENLESYPEYQQAIKAGKQVSQNAYVKDSEKGMNNYTIPPDMPSIKHAREVDDMISNLEYKKSLKQTIDNYRGFQTMDSKHHPIVQHGIKAADLISERKYKADYMEDRNIIYYPVHLTAGYEACVNSNKFASDADYKRWYNKNIRGKGNFPVNLTPGYAQAQSMKPYISECLYKEEYEKGKGSGFTVVPDANEMHNLKVVQPWMSQKHYKEAARDLMGKYHLDVEVPVIARAIYNSAMLSPALYKLDYANEVKGKAAQHLEASPLFKNAIKATKLASNVEYGKAAEEGMNNYTLGLDTTDIQQALIADKLTSDVEYKKSGQEVAGSCQGYFKLNSSQIPQYQKARDVAANASDSKYKEEYNEMKHYVYFPYHITPEYEKKADAYKFFSNAHYMRNYEENKGKQNFKYHEIPAYLSNKELNEVMNVHKDRKALREMYLKGYHTSPDDVTNQHVREVQMRLSNNVYKAAAKEVMDKYNITAELPEIRQALSSSKLVSQNLYKEQHNKEKGQGMDYNPDIPTYQHARKVRTIVSDNLYKDEAAQNLHQYSVIPDTPHLTHAKTVAQQTSDVEYKKDGKEITSKVRGYQFLKASEQRDVAHASKVNDLISPAKYKEEYNELRNIIYFPVHLTDGYETCIRANKFASPATYKRNWLKERFRNNYKVHETEGYKQEREIQKKISAIAYKAEYNRNVGKCPFITETPERSHNRDMKDMFSDKKYRHSARDVMDKYHLITDEPRMVTAIQAMDLVSDVKYKEEYEKEKGKGTANIHETPQMVHALQVAKLTSDKPYRQVALKELQKVTLPEDATTIVHAQEAGKLVSDITYKKDAFENKMQGYNRLPLKDNYQLNRLDKIKDLPSEVQYKKDFYEQKGQLIPVVDTPEQRHAQKQQKIQSDAVYKKDLEKHTRGRGLTTDTTPQLDHAKHMVSLLSENQYKAGTKDQHQWQSSEATNTPTAIKAKETTALVSENKYKEEHEKSKGQGCNEITPAIAHAATIAKVVSENVYKEKHKEDSKIPTAFSVLPSTPYIEHVQKVAQKASEIKYKEQHQKEDIGQPSELKDSVLIKKNKETTELQSNIEYRKQGEKEAEANKGYLTCLEDMPKMKHAKKMRDVFSDFRYKEAYENEKGIVFYPYFLTPQYENQVKAGKLQSQNVYTKKAEEGRHTFKLTTDQPNFKQAKVANNLISDLKYRQPHKGKGAKVKDSRDVPSILHSKKMQELFSGIRYRNEYEKIKDKYHLDVSTPSIVNAKRASQLLSDTTYKEEYNKEKGQPFDTYQDSLQMKHMRTMPDKLSENKYRQDLILSRGKVIQVADTPWLATSKRAQQFISHIKYGQKSGRKLKCKFQPDKFNKHVKNVTDSISAAKYHDDYENFFRGNLIPIPETPETKQAMMNSKLFSKSGYKQKAKEDQQHYLLVPDDPEFQRLKDAATYLSDIAYKGEAQKEHSHFTTVSDTPTMVKAKESQEMQSEKTYKGNLKKDLATGFQLPSEGTATMQQQCYASTLTSDKAYKDKAEQLVHDPTAFTQMKETRETGHAKKVTHTISDIKYKELAKKRLHQVHPTEEDPWMKKAKEVNKHISDVTYKSKDKDMAHQYKLKESDNFMKHAKNVRDNISEANYKKDFNENIGVCWSSHPHEQKFLHAKKVGDLVSQNKYKEEARKMKGKYHIPQDTPEFERFRKVKDDVSESKYKDKAGEFTILESTPDIKHATEVSTLVSKNKYKEDFEKTKGQYQTIEDDLNMNHATQVNKMLSKAEYKKKHKEMQKEGYTLIANRPDTEHMQKVQRNVSDVTYKKEAKDSTDKEFTILEKSPEIEHAVNTAKMQSTVHYKQKVQGKDIEMLKTPSMKHVMGANKLQSELEYRKEFDKEIKGKGWRFTKDTPQQKHVENIGNVQSQYKYTKKYRDNVGTGFTSVTDRPDILHATSCKDVISDNEYKRRHRAMTGKGYTFTPDNPSQAHVEEVTHTQSELQYRRKYDNTGKAWQVEDSPSLGHFKEAQKLVDNIDYRKQAREINARGTNMSGDVTPSSLHHKRAQEILDDRKYKADYERTVKGKGMTFDLHGTPSMSHIKHAEDIKSDILYKEGYEATKGRPTVVMDAPHIINAQKANDLISDVKYKQDYNERRGHVHSMVDTPEMVRARENQSFLSQVRFHCSYHAVDQTKSTKLHSFKLHQVKYKQDYNERRGHVHSMVDTPEMVRARENQSFLSQVNYKSDVESMKGRNHSTILDTPELRQVKKNTYNFSTINYKSEAENMKRAAQSCVLDTPELRRVKQNTYNFSSINYKDNSSKGKSVSACLDTPELRTARQNSRNFSQIKYQSDFNNMKGKYTPVADDLNMQRVKHATRISSDLKYKGMKAKNEDMDKMRATIEGQKGKQQSAIVLDMKPIKVQTELPKHQVVKSEPLRRWKRNPGSIFDYDPSEYETDTEYEMGKPHTVTASAKTGGAENEQIYNRLVTWDSTNLNKHPTPWTNYVMGSGYKHVGAPSSVLDYSSRHIALAPSGGGVSKQFKAMYDYAAADDDEVTFKDGDVIINAQSIDDGWMFGTVLRTGATGMLPANYVQLLA